jgi:hypothetical protein
MGPRARAIRKAEGLPAPTGDEGEGEDGQGADGDEDEAGALGDSVKHVTVGSVAWVTAPRAA